MEQKSNRKLIAIIIAVVVVIAAFITLLIIFLNQGKGEAYTGYDGYIWHGSERSDVRSDEKISDDDAFEHTLEVAGVMAKYFDGGYADLSDSYIALLPHYQKYSQTVLFSEMQIKTVTVFAEQDGHLNVGVAKVENVVAARMDGRQIAMKNVKTFSVKSGQTAITFDEPVFVDRDETIVLGGNGSVSLYYAKNIPVDDEAGNFTLIDGKAHDSLLQNTGGEHSDTLAVEVKAVTEEEKPIFANLREEVKNAAGKLSVMNNVGDDSWGAYIYNDEKLFSGKTITKIIVPVQTLTQVNGRTYLDICLIDRFDKPTSQEAVDDRNFFDDQIGAQNFLNEHRISTPLEISAERFGLALDDLAKQNDNGYGWVEFDCHIEVGENQTIAFRGSNNGVRWCFLNSGSAGVDLSDKDYLNKYKIIGKVGNGLHGYDGFPDMQNFMFFDVYYAVKHTVDTQLEKLESFESEAARSGKLREALSGKQLSILGDSISTYEGYSNEYETQNKDVKGNGQWKWPAVGHDDVGNKQQYFDDKTGIYDNEYNNKTNFKETLGVPTVSDTWWMSTIEQNDMKLCVNNSYAGGLITDNFTIKRSGQLYDNTFGDEKNPGQEGEVYPDIVAIYMGVNDFNASGNVEPDAFYNAYKRVVMNVFKSCMLHSPDLKVFVFTLSPSIAGMSKWSKGEDMAGLDEATYTQNLEMFNNKIRQIASEIDNVEVVDLFAFCNMTRAEMRAYANDAIHPNAAGMKLIADCFMDALYKAYVSD